MTLRTRYAPGEFCWVDLASHGFDAAAHFYAAVFGWQREVQDTRGGPPYALWTNGGAVVAGLGELNAEMRGQGVPATWNLYVAVDDVEEATRRATALGGRQLVPPMPVLDAGRLAFVFDPQGALLGLWEAGSRSGAARIETVGAHCWSELRVRDLEAAQSYYGELFGWRFAGHIDEPADRYALIAVERSADSGGVRQIGGLRTTRGAGAVDPAQWRVCFEVDDLEDRVAKLVEAGGRVLTAPYETPVGPLAVVADLHGAVFQLVQHHHSAA